MIIRLRISPRTDMALYSLIQKQKNKSLFIKNALLAFVHDIPFNTEPIIKNNFYIQPHPKDKPIDLHISIVDPLTCTYLNTLPDGTRSEYIKCIAITMYSDMLRTYVIKYSHKESIAQAPAISAIQTSVPEPSISEPVANSIPDESILSILDSL